LSSKPAEHLSSPQTAPRVVTDQSFRELFAASSLILTFPCSKRFGAALSVEVKHSVFHHASGKLNACERSALYPRALRLGPRTAQLPEQHRNAEIHYSFKLTELNLSSTHSFYLKSFPNSACCTYTKESLYCPHTGISGLQQLPQVSASP